MLKFSVIIEKIENFLLGQKKTATKNNPVLSIIPDSLVTDLTDKAEEVAIVVDQAVENVVGEVKKETKKVVKTAKKSSKKPSTKKKA
jgi:hypothetical protein